MTVSTQPSSSVGFTQVTAGSLFTFEVEKAIPSTESVYVSIQRTGDIEDLVQLLGTLAVSSGSNFTTAAFSDLRIETVASI